VAFVDYEKTGHVVTIRLNRPERRNSLGTELVRDLDEAWRAFASDADARVAIYTGAGTAFCAGMDVKDAAAQNGPAGFPEPPLTIFHAGEVSKPVIAAVNGFAIGGGFFDVMRCDLRIAAESAVLQLAEVLRSVMPHPLLAGIAGGIPDCLVTELALGRRITARRAYEIGLLNSVVDDAELIGEATRTAEEIAALPPLAVEGVVVGLRRARALRPDDEGLQSWQAEITARLRESDDQREALQSFLEKRPPRYAGR
jgi:enoyl-CoA hydratase/carnithine racemase